MASILTSANNIFKTGSVVFTSGEELPSPVIDIDPSLWGYSNGNPVVLLVNSAGSIDAIQSDSAKRATFATGQVNGYPAVDFDGTNDGYDLSAALDCRTIFIVLKSKVSSQSGVACPFSNLAISGVDDYSGYYDGGGAVMFRSTVGSSVFFGKADTDSSRLYLNGTEVIKSTVPWVTSAYNLYCLDISNSDYRINVVSFGYRRVSADNFWNGYIARFIGFDKRLTTIQREAKTLELTTLYGF